MGLLNYNNDYFPIKQVEWNEPPVPGTAQPVVLNYSKIVSLHHYRAYQGKNGILVVL